MSKKRPLPALVTNIHRLETSSKCFRWVASNPAMNWHDLIRYCYTDLGGAITSINCISNNAGKGISIIILFPDDSGIKINRFVDINNDVFVNYKAV